jgi:hypothetical protein
MGPHDRDRDALGLAAARLPSDLLPQGSPLPWIAARLAAVGPAAGDPG